MLEDFADLQMVAHRLSDLRDTADTFLEYLQRYKQNFGDIGHVSVEDGKVSFEVLGHKLISTCRFVSVEAGKFLVEFPVVAESLEEKTPLFCFYLAPNGRVYRDAALTDAIGDFNNQYMAHHLLEFAGLRILDSELFQPTKVEGAG